MRIYRANSKKMHCFLWNELEGEKVKDVICSIMWKFLQSRINPDATLVIWSDGCVSQNCCWRVLKFYGWLVRIGLFKRIVVKLLHKGHSFCKCDSYFGKIQQKKAEAKIEIPPDWVPLISSIQNCSAEMFLQKDIWNWEFVEPFFQKRRVSQTNNIKNNFLSLFSRKQ